MITITVIKSIRNVVVGIKQVKNVKSSSYN